MPAAIATDEADQGVGSEYGGDYGPNPLDYGFSSFLSPLYAPPVNNNNTSAAGAVTAAAAAAAMPAATATAAPAATPAVPLVGASTRFAHAYKRNVVIQDILDRRDRLDKDAVKKRKNDTVAQLIEYVAKSKAIDDELNEAFMLISSGANIAGGNVGAKDGGGGLAPTAGAKKTKKSTKYPSRLQLATDAVREIHGANHAQGPYPTSTRWVDLPNPEAVADDPMEIELAGKRPTKLNKAFII
jgi:hypothetical protein